MLDRIIAALNKLGVEKYNIREKVTSSAELFFIKKDLDVRREKNTTSYSVTVYRDITEDEKKFMGSSVTNIAPGMDEKTVEQMISDAYFAARFVKNPAFELYHGEKIDKIYAKNGLTDLSLAELAGKFTEALFRNDTREDAFLNSTEVFLEQDDIHIISSEGVDVSYQTRRAKGEFIVQAPAPQDVEQYFDFEYDDLNTDALADKVKAALNTVCDRAGAVKRPKAGVYDVILSEENVGALMELYGMRASAQMVYPGYSNYKVGDNVQAEKITGEKLNVSLVPSAPFSPEGIPMIERPLLKDGVLQMIYGDTRFCRYLGIEPTGSYRRVHIENGTVPFEEMKKGCLYPVSFSDFQMNGMSGHFGGEIRLAYYFGENGVEVLTGGSINGSFFETAGSLEFSKETYTDASYNGPFAVKLHNVAVNGEE